MNPLALTEMEAQSLGYNSAAEFDEYYAKLAEKHGDISSIDPKFLSKAAMTRQGIVIVPTSTPVPTPKPVVIPEQRLTAPRKPDSSEQDLVEAQIEKTKKEQEDALARGLGLSEATAQSLRDYTAKTIDIPRDQSGAASVSTPLSWLAGKVGATTLQKALEPQAILSKEQVDAIDKAKADKKATGEWEFTTYYDQNSKEFPGMTRDEFLAEARQYTRDYQNYSPLADSLFGINTTKEFIKRKAQTGTGWTPEYKAQYDQEIGENKGEFDPDVGWLTLFSKRDDKGLVETPLFATVRGLVTGEAIVSQAVDSVFTGQSFSEGLAERVAAGDGLEKGFQQAAEYLGAEPEGTASTLAWWTGLGAGFLLPLDLGVGDLTKTALKAGLKSVEGARELSSLKKLLYLGDNVVRDIKQTDPHILDLRTQIVRNADLIPEVNDVAKVISHVSDDIKSAKNTHEVESYLRAAAKAAGVDFNEFVVKSRSLGLNEYTGFVRGDAAQKASTGMPIGDTGLAWERFINTNRASAKAIYDDSSIYGLRRAVASDIAKKRIDDAIGRGVLPSTDLVMITPTVALKADRVIGFLEELKSKPVPNLLHTKAESTGPITFTADDIQLISDNLPKSVYRGTSIEPEIQAAREGNLVMEQTLSRQDLNTLIDNTVAFYAQREATGQSITEMSTISARAKRIVAGADDKQTLALNQDVSAGKHVEIETPAWLRKFNAATTRIRLEEAFKPVMTRPDGFVSIWNRLISPQLQIYLPNYMQRSIMSPMESFARTGFVQKLGAIPNIYKADYDKAIKAGATNTEAFASTILKPFNGDYQNFWTNYLTSFYGGYDNIVELSSLRSGLADEVLPKPELLEMFREAWAKASLSIQVPTEPALVSLTRRFQEATTDVERLQITVSVSKLLQGRKLEQFTTREGVPRILGLGRAGQFKDLRPVYDQNNLMIPLQASYIQQHQLGIMTDINNSLYSSTGSLTTSSLNKAFDWGNEYVASTIVGVDKSIADEVQAAVADFAKKDYIYVLSSRINQQPPAHADALMVKLLEITDRANLPPQIAEDVINKLGYQTSPYGMWRLYKIPSIGNIIFDTLTGQTAVTLTQKELTAWSKSLLAQSDLAEKSVQKSAYSVLPTSGFYPVEELQDVLKNSASLKATEEAFTAYDYLKNPMQFSKLTKQEIDAVVTQAQVASLDFITKFDEAVSKLNEKELANPEVQAKLKMILQQGAAGFRPEGTNFVMSSLPGFIKNNILGGGWLPNPVYHMQNFLSGPMLMYVNLNRTGRNPVLRFFGDYWLVQPKPFTTPSGRVYTPSEIESLISKGGVESSSVSAEVSKNMLMDMIRYAKKEMTGADAGFIKRTLRNISKYLGFNGLSTWNELAQRMDLAYRRRALVESLQAGESEASAVQTARRALFDYEDLTQFEKDYVAKYLWFYRFMRQNIVQTTVAFIDNPTKIARLAKISKLDIPKAASKLFGDGELHPDTARYKDSKAFLALIAGQDKERYALYSPSVPVLEATAGLLDSMAFYAVTSSIATGSLGFNDYPDKMSRDAAIENFITRFNINPVATAAELGLLRTFGLDINLNDKENISYLDPKFVAWAKATGQWNTLNAYLHIEADANDPRNGITTFDGYYYKLQDDSKVRWQLMMEVLKTVGLQRTMRDYTTILANSPWSPQGMSPGTDISTGPYEDFFKFIGTTSVSPQPSEEEAQSTLRKQKIQQLRGN